MLYDAELKITLTHYGRVISNTLMLKSGDEIYLPSITINEDELLEYDNTKYDDTGTIVCYVYLDNKTFVNNHLIRPGFVDVDLDLDYSCKQKFLKSLPV